MSKTQSVQTENAQIANPPEFPTTKHDKRRLLMKRLISFLCVLAMLLTLLPMAAFAAEG